MSDQIWTVGALAETAAEMLRKKGVESARLDADLLLAHALGLTRLDLFTRFDMPVDPPGRATFREMLRRRLAREPVAYIVGSRDFWNATFAVDAAVLVPRPETEALVEFGLDVLAARGDDAAPPRILELGCGSGCVILSLLAECPEAHGVAVDISAAAVAVARKNADALGVTDRVTFLIGDLFAPLASDEGRREAFDLLVSNPPYIEERERADLPPDVRDHEPSTALFSPEDAAWFHRRILEEGAPYLTEAATILLELGRGGGRDLEDFARRLDPEVKAATARDLAGIERVFIASRRSFPEKWERRLAAR